MEQPVQYVELLDPLSYSSEEQENNTEITKQDTIISNATSSLPEIMTLSEEDIETESHYECIEADQVTCDDNHTIIVHEGRRYIIPTEVLNNTNNTIILDEQDGQIINDNDNDDIEMETLDQDEDDGKNENENEEIIISGDINQVRKEKKPKSQKQQSREDAGDENSYYLDADDGETSLNDREYAVLKDGKLIKLQMISENDLGQMEIDNDQSSLIEQHDDNDNREDDDDDDDNDDDDDDNLQQRNNDEDIDDSLIRDEADGVSLLRRKYRRNRQIVDAGDEEEEEDEVDAEEEEYLEDGDGENIREIDNAVLSEITGRNLITGQTISLNGFLEKIRKKSMTDLLDPASPKRRKLNNSYQYVVVPPVNRRMVVGRTHDGKRVIGNIIQIQKKVPSSSSSSSMSSSMDSIQISQQAKDTFNIAIPKESYNNVTLPLKQQQTPASFRRKQQTSLQPPPSQPPRVDLSEMRFLAQPLLEENVSRTLSGLMELESVNKRLKNRRLFLRHIQRLTRAGKVVQGSKRVAYYYGQMVRLKPDETWTFLPEPVNENGIDLLINNETINPTTVKLRVNADGQPVYNDADDDNNYSTTLDVKSDQFHFTSGDYNKTSPPEDGGDTITLYLTETQDEFGKKKTKVIIPQWDSYNSKNNVDPLSTTAATTTTSSSSLATASAAATTTFVKFHRASTAAKLGGGSGSNSDPLQSSDSGSGSGDHLCPVCGKTFQTWSSLKRHNATHDPSLRPLQCMKCMARFINESSLKKHMIFHTGLRPFKCNICEKDFAHASDLNYHMKTHDPLKRFECEVCLKQFNRHSNMLRHAEIHKPKFKGGTNDKQQQQMDDDGGGGGDSTVTSVDSDGNTTDPNESTTKRYKCEHCGIQYNFSSSLTRHIVNMHLNSATDIEYATDPINV